ncbi:putative disease resistance protein [Cinnamomum micranthum f. kanehirae]|uniref:Putative disease resistance protein n=1 Tax=Cinnamomum micranthum f. kanehirae TaxID=337451 RepID=A0A443NZ36_9MAGN|nr:putative disease resistance protein [Cinnamomum micranthum f. kanehirae]
MDLVGKAVDLCAPHIGYIKNLKRSFEQLNEEAAILYSKKEDMECEINRDRIRKRPKSECQDWLKRVDEVHNKVDAIKEEYSQEAERCQTRWFPDIQSHWKLSQCIVEMTNQISKLTEEYTKFEGVVVVDALPHIVEAKPVLIIEEGTSTKRTLQKILNNVGDPRKHKIGIWGMGGVGKTTVMRLLNNLEEIKQMFEIVIWVTVSKHCSIKMLQTEIAQRLSLKFSYNDSDERVASILFQTLTNMKFLLLIDDLWAKVDLHDIGVPSPNQEKGSKVVLTTRYRDVCHKMGTDEEIRVEPFSEKEAWDLFREKVGEVADSPSIQPLAKRVVGECGGLPLAIAVIGASLRKEDNVHVWKNAVQELSSPDTSDIYDMEEQVFRRLKFSFDRLEDDNVRNCFLYAALYPEDHKINIFELIEYWRAEGLINSGLTLEAARNKGHAILRRIVDSSLLLKNDESIYEVSMHDVIRDLALRITSRKESGCRFLVRAKKMIEEPPKNEEWENVNRMSLMENKISSLPKRPNCPTLLTLLLQRNWRLKTIPESFFDQMYALKVLDLSLTRIESLPHSICHLVNLRGLFLRACNYLRTLPPEIGVLTTIEVLDVQNTQINSLPTEIGQLTCLKVLKVSFPMKRDENKEDVMISGGIISWLSQLEQLSIVLGFDNPDFGQYGNKWGKCAKSVMNDVSCLTRLVSLEFWFPRMEYLKCFLQGSDPWKKGIITSFNFIVGQHRGSTTEWFGCLQERERRNRMLTLCGYDSITSASIVVLSHANTFTLFGQKSVHSLREFGMQNMSGLISCNIAGCNAMGVVMDGNQLTEAALPNLEELYVSYMLNLRSIWEGSFPPGSLNCLKTLELLKCEKLKNIFSREIIHRLSNLEKLRVESCSELEEVISEEEIGVEFNCVLPKLRHLKLSQLPALRSIFKGHQLLKWSSLEEISVLSCHNLKRLPVSISTAPKLRRINCERKWWNELEWDDNGMKVQLQQLCRLKNKSGTL